MQMAHDIIHDCELLIHHARHPLAQPPPRLHLPLPALNRPLLPRQVLEHPALVSLHHFFASLRGHIPGDLLVIIHSVTASQQSYLFISRRASSSSCMVHLECLSTLLARSTTRQESAVGESAKHPTHIGLLLAQMKTLLVSILQQIEHLGRLDSSRSDRKLWILSFRLIGSWGFSRILSKRSIASASNSDILYKNTQEYKIDKQRHSPITIAFSSANSKDYTSFKKQIYIHSSMKRSDFKLSTLAKQQSSDAERTPPPPARPAKTSDELFNDEISEELQYINKHINPILSKLMIRIINEDPKDMVEYMIQYLRGEEELQSKNEFNSTLNKTISPHKRMNESRGRGKDEDEMI